MNLSQKNIVTILGVLFVVLVSAGVWSTTRAPSDDTFLPQTDNATEEILPENLEVGESTEQSGYTIERLPDAPGATPIPTPSLSRAVPQTGGDIDGAAREQAVKNLASLTQSLSSNGDNFNGWLQLGVYRALLGDYQGAREAWEYVTKRYPQDWQAFLNLGNLFVTHITNYALAETNLKTSIQLKKDNPETYRALYSVYQKQGKAKEATAILEEGIRAVPQAVDLSILLARHLRDLGSLNAAKDAYDTAIATAQALKNFTLVTELQAEKAALE